MKLVRYFALPLTTQEDACAHDCQLVHGDGDRNLGRSCHSKHL